MVDEKSAESPMLDTDPMAYEMAGGDEISIRDLLNRLWFHRASIFVWSLAIAVVVVFVGGLVFLLQSRTESGSLSFRLDFAGVENGEYPSGLRFSTKDIISVPVLTQVYKNGRLGTYMKFDEFKGAMSVVPTNDRLKLLEYEYAAKLSDRKLNIDERERIEKEYQEKRLAAMEPVYSLRFSYESRFFRLPRELVAKLLNDTLRTWADYADRTKGAIQYEFAIISPNIINKKLFDSEDYLVNIDMMIATIKRIRDNIGQLKTVPGWENVRGGRDQLSLTDIDYLLSDLVSVYLKPLNSMLYNRGISKHRGLALNFVKNQIFELNLKKREAISQKKVYRESLKNYLLKGESEQANGPSGTRISPMIAESSSAIPAMIPQFGADFLNNLIELGQERSDARFRQEVTEQAIEAGINEVEAESEIRYYMSMLNALENGDMSNNLDPILKEAAKKKANLILKKAYQEILDSIKGVNAIYQDLLLHYLEPQSVLYTILEPAIIKSTKAVSAKRTIMFLALAWFLLEAILLVSVLVCTKDSRHIEHQMQAS
jgi:hypothetical protein